MLGSCHYLRTFHRLSSTSLLTCFGRRTPVICKQSSLSKYTVATAAAFKSNYRYYSNANVKDSETCSEDKQNIDEAEHLRKARLVAVMVGSAVGFIGSGYILLGKMQKAKADTAVKESGSNGDSQNLITEQSKSADEDAEDGKKKKKRGFRERRIVEYENRIRQYSTPDKVFRYFATLKIVHRGSDDEVFMTPADFVRALTPGKIQPEGLGLDAFEKFNPEKHKYAPNYEANEVVGESVFAQMGEHGLISFSDYMFLLTVLSIPPRLFEIAFQMFDLNGDGEVDLDEFEKVQNILFSMTSTGSRHRDHSTTGSVLSSHVNSGLKVCMFGKDFKKKLTAKRFMEFQRQLQKEVMFLEFLSYEPEDGKFKIPEVEFADMLLTYSSFHEKRKQSILKRVRKAFKEEPQGVSFKDYLDFFSFLRNIGEAEIALTFHNAAGKAIDAGTFKRVANTVSDVTLGDHVVDVIYKMFDNNDDGELSHREFVAVMKNQLVRGLENPKDTGFTRMLSAVCHCAKHSAYQAVVGDKKAAK